MTTALTREIGAFISSVSYKDLPPEAAGVVKLGTIDAIGTMMPGRAEPVVDILDGCFRAGNEPAEARLFMSDERVSAPLAALLNGTAMHVLDYDDVALPLGGHPSTVLAPAILAQADTMPDATGQDVLRAYVVGYEVWAELALREAGAHHLKGWHPTSVLGVIGAAAACAALRGLDAETAAQAVGIAASESCGLAANFGSMTKSYHAGRAAQSGLMAARLAEAGMTASGDVLEHPRGLLFALSPEGRIDTDTPCDRLGRDWQIVKHRVGIKKYPMCYAVHRAVDALLDLRAETAVKAADVAAIRVEIGTTQAAILRNARPQTGLEAKFSIEFAMACGLVAGRSGLAELTDEFVQRPEVQRLIETVQVVENPEKSEVNDVFSPYDQVTLTLTNGDVLKSAKVEMARGDWDLPLTRDELWTKFEDCLSAGGVGGNRARALFDALDDMENLPRVSNLPSLGSETAA
ncbi:MAG: MmgE/PrpD family protein [Rhodobacteraceae bacterium]|nr:MmgE/PrpD family protein [Paracoccaceae bacterium]